MKKLLVACAMLVGCGQGPHGDRGSDGSPGTAGINGTSGTVVSVLQLCLGTPSYPSTFIEDAVCINNQLYAVYSTNGGFLTQLTPGAYSSNAVGSRCNFTVLPGCIIHN